MGIKPQAFKIEQIVSWLLLCAALLFAGTVRYRLATFPMERDEGEYAYAGQLLLNGVPPYKLAYNMKLPGTYLAYAAMMAVFGQTTEGIHIGMLAVNLATILMLFTLTRNLFDGICAGGAAIVYAVLSVSSSVQGMAAHATHFVALFGLAGAIPLWNCRRSDDWRLALSSGFLFGLAFLMKQQGVFFFGFGGVFFVARIFRDGGFYWRQGLRNLVTFYVGVVVPFFVTCVWLWWVGVWQAFRFWTFDYAAQYLQVITWHEGMQNAIMWTLMVISGNYLLWLLAFVGLVTLMDGILSRPGVPAHVSMLDTEGPSIDAHSSRRAACWFVLGYLVFSAMCVIPGLLFRLHYYVVILPPLAILAGLGSRIASLPNHQPAMLRWWWRWWNSSAILTDNPVISQIGLIQSSERLPECVFEKRTNLNFTGTVPVDRWHFSLVFLALTVVPTILIQGNYFFLSSPKVFCRYLYGASPFPEIPIVAAYLRDHTEPSDTIAVLGSEPQLYFLSQRRSATGYIYTYPLVEPQPFARQMQEEMIHEIEQKSPAYIVDVQISASWLRRNSETLIFDWKNDFLKRNYKCVGIVDINLRQKRTVFRWDREVEGYLPQSDSFIAIYQRI